MPEKLRIAVTGLAATYPLGGVFWDYLQYPLGLLRLGHEVLFIEDTGQWCYDPVQATFVADGTNNAAILAAAIRDMMPGLADHWYFRDAQGQGFGRSREQVAEFCQSADLFLNISATCWMRDEYYAARRVAFIDSDPMYTQAAMLKPELSIENGAQKEAPPSTRGYARYHVFFSFGENVGQPDCRIPTELYAWIPTRQPIVLDCFAPHRVPVAQRRRALTTVASWEPAQKGPIVRGVQYWGKSVEFDKFLDLPQRWRTRPAASGAAADALTMELAMSGKAPADKLAAHGWTMRDPALLSATPQAYRSYLADSLAEWSVAKNAYVAGRTGWFSCRSACYLALGVPVIVQDTGFSRFLPTGRGLLAFTDMDGALAGIESVLSDPQGHADAAVELAHEYFDAGKVLTRLLQKALA